MTNYEHYKEQIEKFTRLGITFGLDKETKKFDTCYNVECKNCIFHDVGCINNKIKWADEEYIESEEQVNWSELPVDTPILVKDSISRNWERRHFAKYVDGGVYAWNDGLTSFTTYSDDFVTLWSYAKLAEVDNGI